MKYLLLLWLAFPSFLLADATDDKKYLKDLPPMTQENIRWMIPADGWRESAAYKMKKFFYVFGKGVPLKFYNSSNFKEKPLYELTLGWNEFVGKNLTCKKNIRPLPSCKKTKTVCGYQFCTEAIQCREFQKFQSPSSFYRSKRKKISKDECNLPFIISTYNVRDRKAYLGEPGHLYIPLDEIDEAKGTGSLTWKDQKLFINFKEFGEGSEPYNIQFSHWEQQWIDMKKHQEKKDLPELNYFIKNLLPCVKKKDISCVKSYFFNEEQLKGGPWGDFDRGDGNRPQEITAETLNELEACLSYDSLLPHLLALKGKEKVCIPYEGFNYFHLDKEFPNMIMDHLGFPEAVRYSISDIFIPVYDK